MIVMKITPEDRERGRTRVWEETIKELKEAYFDALRVEPQATILITVKIE
jgi:hypothetical protein